ncbi:hypothetical protein [Roseomonas chloroacetimidivorans]|uniref:hypothetical protein n=1 Tax=Roseomonas chloroacetimidivorans TaxID=1766656 RepID=UPI003C790373
MSFLHTSRMFAALGLGAALMSPLTAQVHADEGSSPYDGPSKFKAASKVPGPSWMLGSIDELAFGTQSSTNEGSSPYDGRSKFIAASKEMSSKQDSLAKPVTSSSSLDLSGATGGGGQHQ